MCSVFWDLYCAAPERREQCDHSSEAKAFHDYVSTLKMVAQMHIGFVVGVGYLGYLLREFSIDRVL